MAAIVSRKFDNTPDIRRAYPATWVAPSGGVFALFDILSESYFVRIFK